MTKYIWFILYYYDSLNRQGEEKSSSTQYSLLSEISEIDDASKKYTGEKQAAVAFST